MTATQQEAPKGGPGSATGSGPGGPPNLPPQVAMLQMLGGFRIARSIYVAANLGIADLLADGPKSSEELAQATGTDAPSLYRILRAIASVGIFAEDESGRFTLTPPAEFLQTEGPDSLRATVNLFGEEWHWQVWENLLESVKTGKPAFEQLNGMSFFDFYNQDSEFAKTSSASKTSIVARASNSLLKNYDFSAIGKVVDIGIAGGYGSTLISLLKSNPTMKGVLFDFPPVIAGTTPLIEAAGLTDRCELIAGNCVDLVPSGGDLYILTFVVHNWDDERAIKILKNCHGAMAENGKLLLVEMIMPLGNDPFVGKLIDLESLLLTPGGCERTEAQYKSILAAAGFKVTNVIPTQTANSIIEAVRA